MTHLPQVASQADHHVRVSEAHRTGAARVPRSTNCAAPSASEELARMLGGVEVSQKARDHARDMLKRAAARSAELAVG